MPREARGSASETYLCAPSELFSISHGINIAVGLQIGCESASRKLLDLCLLVDKA